MILKGGETFTSIKCGTNYVNLILLFLGIELLKTQVTVGEFSRILGAGRAKPTVDFEGKFTLIHSPT